MIDLAALIAAEPAFMDGRETVTYTSVVTPSSGNVTVSVPYAVGLAPERRESEAAGGYFDSTERVWWLGAAALTAAGVIPKEGDSITDASGVVWLVVPEVRTVVLGTQYRLTTRKAR